MRGQNWREDRAWFYDGAGCLRSLPANWTDLVAEGITKYNVGGRQWSRPAGRSRVVLVPGQVESDASIAFGARGLRSNIGLLRAARAAAPDAYIVYKPHPDVVARLRRAGAGEGEANEICDETVVDVPMDALLEAVDEVTS